MAASLIPAFNQIRLSGSFVSATADGRMRVGTNSSMLISDSGAFTSVAVVNGMGQNLSGNLTQTGVALGARIDTVTTNLTATGATLNASIIGLSGVMNNTFIRNVSATGFVVAVATGLDYQQVVYPFTFSAAPKVQLTMECSSQSIFYFCGVSSRTTTGFMALYSDVVLETGISLNVHASL